MIGLLALVYINLTRRDWAKTDRAVDHDSYEGIMQQQRSDQQVMQLHSSPQLGLACLVSSCLVILPFNNHGKPVKLCCI
jgi:hypothetical protein